MVNGIDIEALEQTVDAVRAQPGLANVTFGIESTWQSGCRQSAITTDFRQDGATVGTRSATYTLESDEPIALLGSDTAASPGEFILQALAGCYAVTFAASAAMRGIELSSLKFEMHSDFDLHGFLGLDDTVRPGAQEVRVVVHAESPNASRAQLEELTALVQERSPIRDTLASPVAVRTSLRTA